jgi:hypothetical protein
MMIFPPIQMETYPFMPVVPILHDHLLQSPLERRAQPGDRADVIVPGRGKPGDGRGR